MLRYFEKGKAWSRANDQYILDEVATKAIVAQIPRIVTTAAIAELPATDLVAWRNIPING